MKRYGEALNVVGDRLRILGEVWSDYTTARITYEAARRHRITPTNAMANLTWLGHATKVYREQRARLRVAHRDYKRVMRHFLEYKLD